MQIDISAAKTQLSRLVDQVNAGEEVVITRHGRPVARLVPAAQEAPRRKLGTLRGKVWMADDFDAPLPDDLQGLSKARVKAEAAERPWGCHPTPRDINAQQPADPMPDWVQSVDYALPG